MNAPPRPARATRRAKKPDKPRGHGEHGAERADRQDAAATGLRIRWTLASVHQFPHKLPVFLSSRFKALQSGTQEIRKGMPANMRSSAGSTRLSEEKLNAFLPCRVRSNRTQSAWRRLQGPPAITSPSSPVLPVVRILTRVSLQLTARGAVVCVSRSVVFSWTGRRWCGTGLYLSVLKAIWTCEAHQPLEYPWSC